jgi:hypothetical protein
MADLRRMTVMRRGGRYGFTRHRGSLNDRHIRWIPNRCTRERAVDRSRAIMSLPPRMWWALPQRSPRPLAVRSARCACLPSQDAPAAFVEAWRGLLRRGASPHATAALEAEINGLRQIGELRWRELETCGRTAIGGAGRRRRLALGLPNATESATPKRPW